MRPVRKTLRLLEKPDEEADKEVQLRQTKAHLLTIGRQIEKNCEGKTEEWIEEWTELVEGINGCFRKLPNLISIMD